MNILSMEGARTRDGWHGLSRHTVGDRAGTVDDQQASLQAVHVRIAAAQLDERRRIERDLHDGAQQRLLALALRLFAASASGNADRLRREVDHGIGELHTAIGELRDLARGIHPPVLAHRGLAAALEDIARRTPMPMVIEATPARLHPLVEVTAWFVASEAVTNAIKHAHASKIEIEARVRDRHLHMAIADDGIGGACANGSGLRGISDRTQVLGGDLHIDSHHGQGTTIRAELPLTPGVDREIANTGASGVNTVTEPSVTQRP